MPTYSDVSSQVYSISVRFNIDIVIRISPVITLTFKTSELKESGVNISSNQICPLSNSIVFKCQKSLCDFLSNPSI